ncbi:MAG: radical SAM protein [Candidatus Omnitrophota bacterium]|jgi:radical SAM superfamily enzyme YgiQ (UPF0313 family)|nr:MAG: radical SAM protein [Candidatus Omnitrophota bacterium]
MIKIAFVYFYYPYVLNCPPYGILSLAAYMKEKFQDKIEIKLFDVLPGADIRQAIEAFSPDLIGISSFTFSISRAYELADYFMTKRGIKVILGGLHASLYPQESLRHADYVVRGEGERGLVELFSGIMKDNSYHPRIINSEPIADLDTLPSLPWGLVDKIFYTTTSDHALKNLGIKKGCKHVELMTSRWCNYKCAYCYNSGFEHGARYFSAERVIADIRYLLEEWQVDYIGFVDDDFLSSQPRLSSICGLIKKHKLKFQWFCHAHVNSVNPDTLRMIKDSGCDFVAYGFESGSPKILNFLKGKSVSVVKNAKAAKMTNKAGLRVFGYIMMGTPTETIIDLFRTILFVLFNHIDIVATNKTTAYPGSELWKYCIDNRIFNWENDKFEKPFQYIYLNRKYIPAVFFEFIWFIYIKALLPVKQLCQKADSNIRILVLNSRDFFRKACRLFLGI